MRVRADVLLCLLAVLFAAGCGARDDGDGIATAGGTPTPSGSAGPARAGDDGLAEALRHAQCIRDNGVPNFPDPKLNADGGISLDVRGGVDKEKVDAAMERCKHLEPGGGQPGQTDPEMQARALQYAKCMRANGVPRFPDPTKDGGIALDGDKLGVDPRGETFKAAEAACQKYMGPPGKDGAGQSRTG